MLSFTSAGIIYKAMESENGEVNQIAPLFENAKFLLRESNKLSDERLAEDGLALSEVHQQQIIYKPFVVGDTVRTVMNAYVEGGKLKFYGRIFKGDEIMADAVTVMEFRSSDGGASITRLPKRIREMFDAQIYDWYR